MSAERKPRGRPAQRNRKALCPRPELIRLLKKRWSILLCFIGCHVVFSEKPPEALIVPHWEYVLLIKDRLLQKFTTKTVGGATLELYKWKGDNSGN